MTIQEAQKQIKSTSFVENADIFHKQSFKDRADTLALFTIIEALQNGYQLCKVDEVIDTMNRRALFTDDIHPEVLSLGTAIGIVKEACE
jgi:hypothetical protein